MSFRKPCHMPFRKLIPPFTLTDCNGGHNCNATRLISVISGYSYEFSLIPTRPTRTSRDTFRWEPGLVSALVDQTVDQTSDDSTKLKSIAMVLEL